MRKTVLTFARFTPAFFLALVVGNTAMAQKPLTSPKDPAKKEVNVRIIERDGNGVREIERTYRMDGMSDPERDNMVMKLVDSLKAARKSSGKQQMTIIIEDNDGDRIVTRERQKQTLKRTPGDAYVQRGRLPRSNNDLWNSQTWQYNFRQNMDSLADRMHRFNFTFPKDFDRQLARPFENWSQNSGGKVSTVRGLEAYPNNPDRDQLNVRFSAPAKGDVSIIVTNTKGKEVAKRDINDFSGEFVGQIDLGKKAQGTYFITVTQNEDGAVKRIVVE